MDLRKEIETAINKCSAENGSNTPDFILANFLMGCLAAFDAAANARTKWYGYDDKAKWSIEPKESEGFPVPSTRL